MPCHCSRLGSLDARPGSEMQDPSAKAHPCAFNQDLRSKAPTGPNFPPHKKHAFVAKSAPVSTCRPCFSPQRPSCTATATASGRGPRRSSAVRHRNAFSQAEAAQLKDTCRTLTQCFELDLPSLGDLCLQLLAPGCVGAAAACGPRS